MLLIATVPVVAQSGKVTARIVDGETKEGIIGAIMEVRKANSQAAGRHSVSGAEGKVTVTGLTPGDYTATIAFIGYATQEIKVTLTQNADLGVVELMPEAVAIEAVVKEVQALRTSQNGDTVAYNAAAFKVAADADVEGLLKKMPGITISNGQVEAQGEQVKKIFVDGKEFFGEDVSTALNSLPAQATLKQNRNIF